MSRGRRRPGASGTAGGGLGAFLADKPMSQAWRHLPAHANGQLAVGCYMRDDDGVFAANVIDVIELRGDRIASVTGFFLDPDGFAAFGSPP